MKSITSRITRAIPLLLVIWTAHTAQAWYDPGLQRWINRDPINELGFEASHEVAARQTSSNDLGAYLFARNNPVNHVDPNGLLCCEVLLCRVGRPFTVTCYTLMQVGTLCAPP